MDNFTKIYLNIINQQAADSIFYQADDQMIKKAEQHNNKIIQGLKRNIRIDQSFKQDLYNWLNEYFTVGPYNGASMTFYITQSDFLVIQSDYGLTDNINGFKIALNREQWTHKMQWFLTYSFPEEFNKNDIQYAVDVIVDWFNN